MPFRTHGSCDEFWSIRASVWFDLRDPHGFASVLEDADRDEAKAALGYAPTDRVLAVPGFVSEYKGHGVAVHAMRSLPPEYNLAVVGGPHPQSNDWAYDKLLGRSAGRR